MTGNGHCRAIRIGPVGDDMTAAGPPAFCRREPAGEWAASRYQDVQAVLSDPRFEVPPAAAGGAAGTVAWLRAEVSRFTNGPEHQRRRDRAVAELSRLDPGVLRADAGQRAHTVLDAAGGPGDRVDVMALLARWVPMATMAGCLDAEDPGAVAAAVIHAAKGYFPGADGETLRLADAATARLLGLLGPCDTVTAVARISLMIQACDATAGLIGTALHKLQEAPEPQARWPVAALLAEVVRHSPPVRASRRVAREPFGFGGHPIAAGDAVVCSVEAANRDPAVFERPAEFDPGRVQRPSLTFGYGVRPCPGVDQALMLAAGVVEAVTQRCRLLPGQQIGYEPSQPLRIPQRLEVVLG
jgi:cytochrome P450